MSLEVAKFLLQAAISVAGAFLAAYLAGKRFRNERWWEKKAAAYAELVDALHKMKWPYSEHLDAAMEQRDISKDESTSLWEEFKTARRNVWRIADSSSFLISPEVMKAVQKMEQALGDARTADSWFEHLDAHYGAINSCLSTVKEIGKKELGVHDA